MEGIIIRMWVINCSDYLQRQIMENRWAAHQLLQTAQPQRRHWLARLWGWLTGNRREKEAQQRRLVALGVRDRRLVQGQRGEDMLAYALGQRLDNRYILLRNYTPPPPFRSGGDIDALLLGPHGITMFEVKAWHGVYRCNGSEWLFLPRSRAGWEPAAKNPTQQAALNLQRVQGTLNLAGLNTLQAQPVIAIADPKMRLEITGEPTIPFYFLYQTPDRLDFLATRTSFSQAEIERIWFALLPKPVGVPQR